MRRSALVLGPLIVIAVSACGSSTTTGGAARTTPTSAAPSPASPGSASSASACSFTANPGDNPGTKPAPGLPTGVTRTSGTATMTILLSSASGSGTVKISIDAAKTPCTLQSFSHLAGKGFFDATVCHRLTTSGIFVLQCGDPSGTGTGGPGYTIPDENLGATTLPAGTIAMANTGQPHTGGSQFFICYKDTQLPASYTPFGTITAGLDVVQKIAAAGSDDANGSGDGAPKQVVHVTTITVS